MIANTELIYEIVGFDEVEGSLTVACDGLPAHITMALPIVDGRFPEGEALDTFIRGYIPPWLVARARAIAAGVSNVSEVTALVGTRRP